MIRKIYIKEIILIVYIALSISGLNTLPAMYIRLALLAIWMLGEVVSESDNGKKLYNKKLFLSLMLFLLFFFFLAIISTGVSEAIKYTVSRLLILSPVIFMASYFSRGKEILKVVFIPTCIVWGYFCLKDIMFYISNPRAARILAANSAYYGNSTFGGGYALAYGSALIAVVLLVLIINRRIKEKSAAIKILLSAFFALNVLLVIQTASVVTMIAMFVGIGVTLYLNIFDHNERALPRIIGIFLAILLIIVFVMTKERIAHYFLVKLGAGDDIVTRRFREIGLELIGNGSSESDFTYRIKSIMSSFVLFCNHPIMGNGYLYGFDFREGELLGIGNHGEFADILAVYGLLGGIPLLYCYKYALMRIRRFAEGINLTGVMICFIILFFFNPFLTFQSNYALFFIFPGFIVLLSKERSYDPHSPHF